MCCLVEGWQIDERSKKLFWNHTSVPWKRQLTLFFFFPLKFSTLPLPSPDSSLNVVLWCTGNNGVVVLYKDLLLAEECFLKNESIYLISMAIHFGVNFTFKFLFYFIFCACVCITNQVGCHFTLFLQRKQNIYLFISQTSVPSVIMWKRFKNHGILIWKNFHTQKYK